MSAIRAYLSLELRYSCWNIFLRGVKLLLEDRPSSISSFLEAGLLSILIWAGCVYKTDLFWFWDIKLGSSWSKVLGLLSCLLPSHCLKEGPGLLFSGYCEKDGEC